MEFCNLCKCFIESNTFLCHSCQIVTQEWHLQMFKQSQAAGSLPQPAQVDQRQQSATYSTHVEQRNTGPSLQQEIQDLLTAHIERQRILQPADAQSLDQSQALIRHQPQPTVQVQGRTSTSQSDATDAGSHSGTGGGGDGGDSLTPVKTSFQCNSRLDTALKNMDSYKPFALKEKWHSITQEQYDQNIEALNNNSNIFRQYFRNMAVADYSNFNHIRAVLNFRSSIEGWKKELADMLQKSLQTQSATHAADQANLTVQQAAADSSSIKTPVDSESAPQKLQPVSAPAREPEFGIGVVDYYPRIRDIRQKRFRNCGSDCITCRKKRRPFDHPPFACGTMYEIFSHWVGEKLGDKSLWCQTCLHQHRYEIAKYHQLEQCELGAWYDHPENKSLRQFAKWNHPYPSHVLNWKPKKPAHMYADMRAAYSLGQAKAPIADKNPESVSEQTDTPREQAKNTSQPKEQPKEPRKIDTKVGAPMCPEIPKKVMFMVRHSTVTLPAHSIGDGSHPFNEAYLSAMRLKLPKHDLEEMDAQFNIIRMLEVANPTDNQRRALRDSRKKLLIFLQQRESLPTPPPKEPWQVVERGTRPKTSSKTEGGGKVQREAWRDYRLSSRLGFVPYPESFHTPKHNHSKLPMDAPGVPHPQFYPEVQPTMINWYIHDFQLHHRGLATTLNTYMDWLYEKMIKGIAVALKSKQLEGTDDKKFVHSKIRELYGSWVEPVRTLVISLGKVLEQRCLDKELVRPKTWEDLNDLTGAVEKVFLEFETKTRQGFEQLDPKVVKAMEGETDRPGYSDVYSGMMRAAWLPARADYATVITRLAWPEEYEQSLNLVTVAAPDSSKPTC